MTKVETTFRISNKNAKNPVYELMIPTEAVCIFPTPGNKGTGGKFVLKDCNHREYEVWVSPTGNKPHIHVTQWYNDLDKKPKEGDTIVIEIIMLNNHDKDYKIVVY